MIRPFALVMLLAVALPHFAAVATAGPDPVAEVLAFEIAACNAYLHNDAAAIDSLVANGYVLTDSRGQLATKADDLKAARDGEVRFTEFRNVGMTVSMFGTTAIVRGRTLVKGATKDGQSIDVDVLFTDTVVRLNGRWQLVAGHVSRTPKP